MIRADAASATGLGHIIRCLALAEAWGKNGGAAVFAVAHCPDTLRARLDHQSIPITNITAPAASLDDASQTVTIARSLGAAWVVIDGYHFDASFQRALSNADLRVLAIDDYGHATDYTVDAILNQNHGATEHLYPRRSARTHLLLGSRYALLRGEFSRWRTWRRRTPRIATRVLITCGGSDPLNLSTRIVTALRHRRDLELTIISGPANTHLPSLRRALHKHAPRASLILDSHDMPAQMARAHIAIAAAGSTSWELAFMSVPAVLLAAALNQRPIAEALSLNGAALTLAPSPSGFTRRLNAALDGLIAFPARRRLMSQCGRTLIDGLGASRVVRFLRSEPQITATP